MINTVSSLLMPYGAMDNILVPKNIVDCILPYATTLFSNYKDPSIIGTLIYKDARVPIINLKYSERLSKEPLSIEESHYKCRIVVLSCANESAFCKNYAIIATGSPFLIDIKKDTLTEVNAVTTSFFYSKVKIELNGSELLSYIPNFDNIEKIFSTS